MAVHFLHLRDGDVEAREPEPGRFVLTWTPRRTDHPDYPGITLDSERDAFPTAGGMDAVLDWAREYFDSRDPRDLAVVSLDREASEAEATAVTRIFDAAGVPAVVSRDYVRMSADALPWALIIEVPLSIGAIAFFKAFGTAAGTDAWEGLKRLVRAIYEARRRPDRPEGSIRLDSGNVTVILVEDLPDEAYIKLAEMELGEGGYYLWDAERGEWHTPI